MTRESCHVCGAPYGDKPPLYCRSCRAKQATGVADLDAYRNNPERFELVAQHAAYPAAQKWRPRLSASAELGGPLAVLLLVLVWGGGISAIVAALKPEDALAWAFPAISGLMVLFALVRFILAARRLGAPTVARVAVIAEDIFRPKHGGDPLGIANHRVLLRDQGGEQRTVFATSELMGRIALTDIGVAYTQGHRLVDFRVFDVMPAPLGPDEPARPPSCSRCAAPYSFESRTTCVFCSAPLDHPDLGEHGAHFARLRDAADTRKALDEKAVLILPEPDLALVLLGLALIAFYGLWAFRFGFFFLYDHWRPGLAILLPWVGFICFAAIYGRRRLAPRLTRRRRELVRVVREREDAWAEVNGRPVIAHYVTLAGPGGGRIERRCEGTVARMVAPGMFGVAHIQAGWLANFTRLEDP